MTAKDTIRGLLDLGDFMFNGYLGDLSDDDILIRPVPGMNHIAWQLGHILNGEKHFVDLVRPGSSPALPADFEAGHGKDASKEDDPKLFYSVARYQELMKAQREATRAVLESVSDAELDRTEENFPPYAPTVGALLGLCGSHPIMHAGQFVAVRRLLNKPITF